MLIAPKFYQYHIEIIRSLESQGANVIFYPEMVYSIFYRLLAKISQKIEKYLQYKYMQSLLNEELSDDFHIVFVIRGVALSSSIMESMRDRFTGARFIMYQWDSNNQNNYQSIIKYFDNVATFDMVDAKKYGLKYLPLFYIDCFADLKGKREKKYDLVFYGAFHSDRLKIVKYFHNKLLENNMKFKSHLYITKLALFRFLITGVIPIRDVSFFSTSKVSFDEIVESYSETLAVLDVELSIQNGLSMRTFETLGAKLKLITTNKNIKKEQFYNLEKIAVIDRKKPDLDVGFIKTKIEEESDFTRFHIDSWVDQVITVD